MEAPLKTLGKGKNKKANYRNCRSNAQEESGLLSQDDLPSPVTIVTVSQENEQKYCGKGKSNIRCDDATAEEKQKLLASPAKSVLSDDYLSEPDTLSPRLAGFHLNESERKEDPCAEGLIPQDLDFKESAPVFEGYNTFGTCDESPQLPLRFETAPPTVTVLNPCNECVQELLENSKDFEELSRLANEPSEVIAFTEIQSLSVYRNEELEMVPEYVERFLDSELKGGSNLSAHPLYVLLVSYLKSRERRGNNAEDIESLLKECEEIQGKLWSMDRASVTESGECQDGNPVEATHDYQIGHFDRVRFTTLAQNLSSVRELVNDEHSVISHSCEITKLQIEHFLQSVTAQFAYLPHNSPVSLNCQSIPYKTSELHSAISVLFHFQRLVVKDQEFIGETRSWLSYLVSVLLRVATWQSHMFILNHVLRCPSGVTKWAINFIQLPLPPFNSSNAGAYLNHAIAVLAVILSPIKLRDQFLPMTSRSAEEDDIWVVVDSDGEDEEDSNNLNESDLITLLNQIPIDSLFRQILLIVKREEDTYSSLSSSQLLRVFTIMKVLLRVLRHGLSNEIGLQLAKRLASLVNHTVRYATDIWECFLQENNESHDKCLIERLQVEYNDIMFYACQTFLLTSYKTILQFLASLPFKMVSLPVLWRIYNLIFHPQHNTLEVNSSILQWWAGVEEMVPKLSDDELYYILNCASNMALSRHASDWIFIKMITIHLLQIGYLNTSTRDKCYKTTRTLLSNLTFKYPSLISVLLEKLKSTACRTGNFIIYLFKDLPLDTWRPTTEDLVIFENWLLVCPLGSTENNLVRFILSNMQWGLNPNSNSELFIKREIHCQIGLMVTKAAIKYCPETVNNGSSSVLAETIKQLTNCTVGKALSNEQSLSMWAWEMLFKLRLHLLDQPDCSIWATLNNPGEHFSKLPSLESATNEINALTEGIAEKQVSALYLMMVMTLEGHSVPLICNTGFGALLTLVQCHRYVAAINLIQYIFPLFTDCPTTLTTSEQFIKVISGIVVADKSFLRTAKNLIIPSYPGLVLRQFGDMILYLLENYRKYNQASPIGFTHMWLQILCKVWNLEPTGVTYLLDIVLQVAFFRPDVKLSSSEILCDLFQGVTSAAKSAKFSLTNWVSSSAPTLIHKSAPDTPWFALFILELEELFTQTKNGLWKQLLVDLSASVGKANVDLTLKKTCASLKTPTITSANLAIYRWSQQALDTPVDHPLLPIIWQKFFSLYLARVPVAQSGGHELGSVGEKFFEGMTNLTYLKKIKRKLRDCKDYYEGKCANMTQVVSEERKKWLNDMAKLYTTLGLWLEEPRLHEPEIYLPSLPPQYDPHKLSKIFSSESNLWYEYIDYEAVRNHLKEGVNRWEKSVFRSISQIIRHDPKETDLDPVGRMLKRLQCYECPVSCPPVKIYPPVLSQLPREAFQSRQLLMDILKPSLKLLIQFAQTASLRRAEHTSLDCTLLEILPILYKSVEVEVKLYAACDTHNPNTPKPSPDSLNCAGPATIRLKVCETKLNGSTEVAIKNNRMEMLTIIKRTMQPPPQQVVVASAHVEHVIKELEKEWKELNHLGDAELIQSLQEGGASVFYHMTSLFNDDVSSYSPFKKLITTCVDILGQAFVSRDERQSLILLTTVIETPSLASLLASHFEPAQASPSVYLQLYQTLISAPMSLPEDLLFVLLTKFEMGQWLKSKKPRVSERSQLIELVGNALSKSGQTPQEKGLMIHEVLRRHLCVLMMYDAPQHYGEVVLLGLKHTESHCLAIDVWYDIINAITSPYEARFRPLMPLAQVVQEMVKYATLQTLLSYEELFELSNLIYTHFNNERLQYGLYGLYPKYRNYVSPITSLLGILGHTVVVSSLHRHSASNPLKVCEDSWVIIVNLFSPWLCPYFTQSLAQPTAAWIQQLTDDRSILPPWISGDSGYAHKLAAIFTEIIRFILDILPGNGDICSYVWQFYVTNFAHQSVKEHILTVIHGNLLSIPWDKFFPTLYDLDLMLKVSDTYVPYCHSLLGAIFIEVPWSNWIQRVSDDPIVCAKVHNSLLHLLIKLANEPSVRQSGKIIGLLNESFNFHWEVVDCSNYESVVNWFVMSYDPRVIFKVEEGYFEIDFTALELLKVSAGYSTVVKVYSATTPRKRQIFVRACSKLIISSLSKYKNLLNTERSKIDLALEEIITHMESIISENSCAEGGLLLSELLTMLNLPEGHSLPPVLTQALLKWLLSRGATAVGAALLRTAGTAIQNSNTLGAIVEATLTSLFNDVNGPTWTQVKSYIQEAVPRHPPLEDTLYTNGNYLTLYSFLLKRLSNRLDLTEENNLLGHLTNWISSLKPSDINSVNEAKVILLFHLGLYLMSRLCDHTSLINIVTFLMNLEKLIQSTHVLADFKPSWGLLGAIGLKKQLSLSPRFRFISKYFSLTILNQLPLRKGGSQGVGSEQYIRTRPHSPGGLTCSNVELMPREATMKTRSSLEELINEKAFTDIKHAIERSIRLVEMPENSLHNAHRVFLEVVQLVFSERFLNVEQLFDLE